MMAWREAARSGSCAGKVRRADWRADMAPGEHGSTAKTWRRGAILPQAFYARDTLVVARELLGKWIRREGVTLRITEVEAYPPDDSASHCRMGRTERNAPMWGPPGHAYVYLCYGVHQMLNVVSEPEGAGAAVLIRACEPVEGLAEIVRRRGGVTPRGRSPSPTLLAGPGKVGQALGLDTGWSRHALFRAGGLTIHEAPAPAAILAGPRVGIDYAAPADQAAPRRLAIADCPWVTVRGALRPV
jgi:DNA-3-methyladenine glycosylase